MQILTTCWPESSLLRFGACSVLLHVGVVTMLDIPPAARVPDEPKPPITVTLLQPPEPVVPEPPPDPIEDTPPDPIDAAPERTDPPPMLRVQQRERVVAPQRHFPAPETVRLPPRHVTRTETNSLRPPSRRPATRSGRKLLLDHRASDTLKLKNFMKATTRRDAPAARASNVQHEDRIVIAATNTAREWAPPPPAPPLSDARARHTQKMFRDTTADRRGLRTPVRAVKDKRPPYPRMARKRGWEGTVVLRLTVTPEGTVEQAVVRTSSGFPILDESALRTVQTWKFEPARDGEFAVATTVELPVRFSLDDQ